MSREIHLPGMATLAVGIVAITLLTLIGCHGQPELGSKGNASAETKKVTIDVTGLT